jgi:8-oxo-dGTP pyrophosphatase MutT (NUDIX family)
MDNLTFFCAKDTKENFSLKPFVRSVAVIIIKNSSQIIIYDRNDNILRFPGGHVEINETEIETAMRESEEEIGLKGLVYKQSLEPYHFFYTRKNNTTHVLEKPFLFETSFKNWENKKTPEANIYPKLININDLKNKNIEVINFVLKQVKI